MFQYLKKEDQPFKVCKTMFLKTLGRLTVLNQPNKVETVSQLKKNDSEQLKIKDSTSKHFELERQQFGRFLASLKGTTVMLVL